MALMDKVGILIAQASLYKIPILIKKELLEQSPQIKITHGIRCNDIVRRYKKNNSENLKWHNYPT